MDEILQEWYDIKQQLKQLKHRNSEIKRIVHGYMNHYRTNSIIGDNLVCTRSTQTRASIQRDDVPVNTWNRYATVKTHKVLSLTPL